MVEKTLFISGMLIFAMLTTPAKEDSASHARIAPVWQIVLGIIAILLCVASAHGQVCLD
jgi:choline-glycine betaine transporter